MLVTWVKWGTSNHFMNKFARFYQTWSFGSSTFIRNVQLKRRLSNDRSRSILIGRATFDWNRMYWVSSPYVRVFLGYMTWIILFSNIILWVSSDWVVLVVKLGRVLSPLVFVISLFFLDFKSNYPLECECTLCRTYTMRISESFVIMSFCC